MDIKVGNCYFRKINNFNGDLTYYLYRVTNVRQYECDCELVYISSKSTFLSDGEFSIHNDFLPIDEQLFEKVYQYCMSELAVLEKDLQSKSYSKQTLEKGDILIDDGYVLVVGKITDNEVYYDLFGMDENHYEVICNPDNVDVDNCNIAYLSDFTTTYNRFIPYSAFYKTDNQYKRMVETISGILIKLM